MSVCFSCRGGRGGDSRYVVGRPDEVASIEHSGRDLRHLPSLAKTDEVQRFPHTVDAAQTRRRAPRK